MVYILPFIIIDDNRTYYGNNTIGHLDLIHNQQKTSLYGLNSTSSPPNSDNRHSYSWYFKAKVHSSLLCLSKLFLSIVALTKILFSFQMIPSEA